MTGTLIVNAQTWDAQNRALRDYEDRIEQLQEELQQTRLDFIQLQGDLQLSNKVMTEQGSKATKLQKENVLLRETVKNGAKDKQTAANNWCDDGVDEMLKRSAIEDINTLNSTPQTAKIQAVLDAAGECASFYEEHIDFYNPEDTRGFDVGEAMRLLSKCNEAVREYKE